MTYYTDLRDDIAGIEAAFNRYHHSAQSHLLEQSRQIDKLWEDNAALREEVHAVANRVESLTRAALTEPAEVAAKIVTDANRQTLREVRNDD